METAREAATRLTALLAKQRFMTRAHVESARNALNDAADEIERLEIELTTLRMLDHAD